MCIYIYTDIKPILDWFHLVRRLYFISKDLNGTDKSLVLYQHSQYINNAKY
jgi:hypothetical protein